MATPTNTDIMQELGFIKERVNATHNLAVKTNGRVTKLEGALIEKRAVDAYKKRVFAVASTLFVCFATLVGALWWVKG